MTALVIIECNRDQINSKLIILCYVTSFMDALPCDPCTDLQHREDR